MPSSAFASPDYLPGFVRSGTFVIPSVPNAVLQEKHTRERTGYLPVGTVVFVETCIQLNEDASTAALTDPKKTYCEIVSSLGVNGLVRRDKIKLLGDSKVGVAVGDKKVLIYPADATTPTGKTVSEFSRTDHWYVEIVGEKVPGFYDVLLPWTAKERAKWRDGRLAKKTVESGEVIVIDAAKLKARPVEFKPVTGTLVKKLQEKIGLPTSELLAKISKTIDKVAEDLRGVRNLQCIVDVKLVQELGLRIFGTGLGLVGTLNLFEKGHLYEIDTDFIMIDGRPRHTVISLKKVKCEVVLVPFPVWMTAMGLFVDRAPSLGNSILVINEKNLSGYGSGVIIPVDVSDTPPMFEIKDWYDYQRRLRLLRKNIPRSKLLKSLPSEEADIFLHFLLNKIAFFYPELLEK